MSGRLAASAGSDIGRRVLVTLGALVLYRLGHHLPLPGLDPDALSMIADRRGYPIQRYSIFALGVVPIFGVLFVLEIAKMAFPALASWETARPGSRTRYGSAIVIAALALTALQAYGVATVLSTVASPAVKPRFEFIVAIVATEIGATALLFWLGRLIDTRGLGDGLWLILASSLFADLPREIGQSAEGARAGAIPASALVAFLAFPAIAAAPIVAAHLAGAVRARRAASAAAPTPRFERQDIAAILWPPILAYIVSLALIWLIGLAIPATINTALAGLLAPGGVARMLILTLLLPVFTMMRARAAADAGRPALLMALAQMLVMIAGAIVSAASGLPLLRDALIVIIVATLAVNLLAWTTPPGPGRA